jgi:RNA polymerase sigma factor (sigma-70 family)
LFGKGQKSRRLLALGVTWILSGAYALPFLDRGWIPHDEGLIAQSAERVLAGELPHRDFGDAYTGGLSFLHAAGFRLLGVRIVSLRVVLFLFFLMFVLALYAIASRACIRMRRKRKGEPERELSLDEFIPTSEGEFRLQIPTDGLTPEEALENKELRRALHQAIQKLPKKYRLVLVLRDMEGLTAKEVGSIMGLNERAVKSRLHRARLFVRRELSARGIAGHRSLAQTTGSS